jgi:hypothetical protein
MGTGSGDEFQEAGTSLTRAVQYHGAALERAWWELVGTRVEGARARRLRAINSTVYTFAEQTHTQTQTQTLTQLHTQTVDAYTPASMAPCSGRLHRSLGGCQRSSSAMLVHARPTRLPTYYINPVLGSLHLGFPASCTCPHFANSKNSNWRPAREPRLSLHAGHALHPSMLDIPLLPCHRDRSGARWLTRLPARQLCPLTPRS